MSTCTVCGGTGIQRVSSQRFRTCLECLGTGKIIAVAQSASANPLKTAEMVMSCSSSLPGRAG